jgi:hypothetical protein
MKKILLSTIVLLAFSFSCILFQISCKKNADAASPTNTSVTQQGKILYKKLVTVNSIRQAEIWTANYDGSSQTKINITLPAGLYIAIDGDIKLSPDQKTIFLVVEDNTTYPKGTYSCNIDGSNVKEIFNDYNESVQVAY